jgi:hypothetical protein
MPVPKRYGIVLPEIVLGSTVGYVGRLSRTVSKDLETIPAYCRVHARPRLVKLVD